MLDRFAWLVEGLIVYADRMRSNLDASRGLFFSQRLLLALVESGLARDDAYRLVQELAMRAWDEERDFPELAHADERVRAHLPAALLAEVFSLDPYLRHVDVVFERLHALARGEEPVHA
jgi:adenylosuccinate lyase